MLVGNRERRRRRTGDSFRRQALKRHQPIPDRPSRDPEDGGYLVAGHAVGVIVNGDLLQVVRHPGENLDHGGAHLRVVSMPVVRRRFLGQKVLAAFFVA